MQAPLITWTSTSKEEVHGLFVAEKDVRLRARYQAIFLLLDGWDANTVAAVVGKSVRAVYYWAEYFNAGGPAGLRYRCIPGRTPRLAFWQYLELEEALNKHPGEVGHDFALWDGKKLAWHIKQKYGVDLKVRQCEKILHLLGYSLQRPAPRPVKADPVKQAAFRENLQKNETTAPSAPTT